MSAEAILELALSRRPTLGSTRLVRIDGPSGSGKTTLARDVARLASERDVGRRVLHLDAMYDGWSGLPRIGDQLDTLLLPLSRDEAGRHGLYDWRAGRYARTVVVDPLPLLVLEGVGAGLESHDTLSTVLVWVSAPPGVRRERAIARDGEDFAPRWDAWAAAEAAHFARERTWLRADLLVDGVSGRLSEEAR